MAIQGIVYILKILYRTINVESRKIDRKKDR